MPLSRPSSSSGVPSQRPGSSPSHRARLGLPPTKKKQLPPLPSDIAKLNADDVDILDSSSVPASAGAEEEEEADALLQDSLGTGRITVTSLSPVAGAAVSRACRRCGAYVAPDSICHATGEPHRALAHTVATLRYARPGTVANASADVHHWSLATCPQIERELEPTESAGRQGVVEAESANRRTLSVAEREGSAGARSAQAARESRQRQDLLNAQMAGSRDAENARLRLRSADLASAPITASRLKSSVDSLMDGNCRRCGRRFRDAGTCFATGELHAHMLVRLAPKGIERKRVLAPSTRADAAAFLRDVEGRLVRGVAASVEPDEAAARERIVAGEATAQRAVSAEIEVFDAWRRRPFERLCHTEERLRRKLVLDAKVQLAPIRVECRREDLEIHRRTCSAPTHLERLLAEYESLFAAGPTNGSAFDESSEDVALELLRNEQAVLAAEIAPIPLDVAILKESRRPGTAARGMRPTAAAQHKARPASARNESALTTVALAKHVVEARHDLHGMEQRARAAVHVAWARDWTTLRDSEREAAAPMLEDLAIDREAAALNAALSAAMEAEASARGELERAEVWALADRSKLQEEETERDIFDAFHPAFFAGTEAAHRDTIERLEHEARRRDVLGVFLESIAPGTPELVTPTRRRRQQEAENKARQEAAYNAPAAVAARERMRAYVATKSETDLAKARWVVEQGAENTMREHFLDAVQEMTVLAACWSAPQSAAQDAHDAQGGATELQVAPGTEEAAAASPAGDEGASETSVPAETATSEDVSLSKAVSDTAGASSPDDSCGSSPGQPAADSPPKRLSD